ncbi:MAG: hypothetical protein VX642_02200 [Bdellovibrionota bacterium]|nr:hypothetical protein [Bdellovibrionota bacterium]
MINLNCFTKEFSNGTGFQQLNLILSSLKLNKIKLASLFSIGISLLCLSANANIFDFEQNSISTPNITIEDESALLLTDYLLKNLSPASSQIKNPELKRVFEEQYNELEKVEFLLEKIDQRSSGSEEEDFLAYFNQSLVEKSKLSRDFARNAKQLAAANYSRDSIAKIELNSEILDYVFRRYRWTEKSLPDVLKQKICASLEGLVLASQDTSKKIQLYYLNSLVQPLDLTEEFYCDLKDNQRFYLIEQMNDAMKSLEIDSLEPSPANNSNSQTQIHDYQLIPNTELKIDFDENIAFCQPEEQIQSAMKSVQVLYGILSEDSSWRANMSDLIISYQKTSRSNCRTRHRFQGRIDINTVITEDTMQKVLNLYFAK